MQVAGSMSLASCSIGLGKRHELGIPMSSQVMVLWFLRTIPWKSQHQNILWYVLRDFSELLLEL
jgi:hypothetical protein